MVHEQDDTAPPNSRKRSYPFIQWLSGDSPPQSSSGSGTEPEPDLASHASLPSPPLQSNKYKAVANIESKPANREPKHSLSWVQCGVIV